MKWDGKPYKKKNPVISKSANKNNAPPSDPDHQDVPHSMKEFMKLKQLAAAENAGTKKNKNKKETNLKNSEKQQSSVKSSKKESSNVTPTPTPKSTSDISSSKANIRKEKLQGLKKKKRLKYQKLKDKRKLKK
ncbi:uncharacterized protein LOC135843677 [Planococcus citri]|uniref:uncharacterized protein LOC135843677 n=1 Tax=Planococcus citri TaxID=170843 RepID=UPI0031F7CFB0